MRIEELLKELRKIRKMKGVSLRKMAKALEVSAQLVSMIERGKVPLKVDEYCKMCAVLGVSPSELLRDYE